MKITKNRLKEIIKEELNIYNEQEDEMAFPPDEVVVEPGERGHPLTEWLSESRKLADWVEELMVDAAALEAGDEAKASVVLEDGEFLMAVIGELVDIVAVRQG